MGSWVMKAEDIQGLTTLQGIIKGLIAKHQ